MLRDQFSISVRNARAIALFTLLVVAAAAAPAQTYAILHSFAAGTDGATPNPMISDGQGNFYGTTRFGGITSCNLDTCGTVFKIDSAGNETILYRFQGGNNGSNPLAAPVLDAKGNLYGTTQGNGFVAGASVVFKVEPNGNETSISMTGPNSCCLDSPLAVDAEGNLYGMSPYSGQPNCGVADNGLGCGTLFKITPSRQFEVLHVFTGTDGIQPEGGVVLDAQGNIYGTAVWGGDLKCKYPGWGVGGGPGCGTIYKLEPSGKFTVLHTFTGPNDGSYPLGLIIDSDGNLYGIADSGGDIIPHSNYEYGLGTVFKVDASGKFSVLFTFTPETTLNYLYASHLVRDSQGNLYGIEQANNCGGGGCIFKIDPQGNYTVVYAFTFEESGDPAYYNAMGLILGPDGDFYGSTGLGESAQPSCDDEGITQGCGSIFHLVL